MSKKVIEREAKIMQGAPILERDLIIYLGARGIVYKPKIIYTKNVHTKGENTIKLREYIDVNDNCEELTKVASGHNILYKTKGYEIINKVKSEKGSKIEVAEEIKTKEQFDQLVNMIRNVGSKDELEIYYAKKTRYNLGKVDGKFSNMTIDFCEIMFTTNPKNPEKGIYVPLPLYAELEYLAKDEDDKFEFKDAYKLLLKEIYEEEWKTAKELFTTTEDSIRNLIKRYRKYLGSSK